MHTSGGTLHNQNGCYLVLFISKFYITESLKPKVRICKWLKKKKKKKKKKVIGKETDSVGLGQ